MKKNLYIFRHGQTDFNLRNICQGCRCNLELNATGKRQAYELGQKLLPQELETIYCSPLKRALQTAEIVSKQMKNTPKIEIIPNLKEANFGIAEGIQIEKLCQDYPEIVECMINPTKQNWDTAFPGCGSESKHQIFDRSIKALEEVVCYASGSIGVSTHGSIISALACGLELSNISQENCSLLHLIYDTDTRRFSHAQ